MRAPTLARVALRVIFVVATLSTRAADPVAPHSDWNITIAGKAWFSSGRSNWSFRSAGIDPQQERRWRGIDAPIGEINAEVTWKRWSWNLGAGDSNAEHGTVVQNDFAQSGRQGRFSTARSRVEDNAVRYVSGDVGARVLTWAHTLHGSRAASKTSGYVDVLVGGQYWKERYSGFGVEGGLFLPSGFVVPQSEPSNVRVVTDTYTRRSIRVGAQTQLLLIGNLSLKAQALFSPNTRTKYEDTQHLQTGVMQPTVSSANGGVAAQLEAGLSYTVWHGLSAEAGFRYWHFDSGSGDVITKAVNGTAVRNRLNEVITERSGLYVGMQWRF